MDLLVRAILATLLAVLAGSVSAAAYTWGGWMWTLLPLVFTAIFTRYYGYLGYFHRPPEKGGMREAPLLPDYQLVLLTGGITSFLGGGVLHHGIGTAKALALAALMVTLITFFGWRIYRELRGTELCVRKAQENLANLAALQQGESTPA